MINLYRCCLNLSGLSPRSLPLLLAVALVPLTGCSMLRTLRADLRANTKANLAKQRQATMSEQKLAEHLRAQGAVLYGTSWCAYCHKQKAMFGNAVDELTEVECDSKQKGAEPAKCNAANISAYPSWEINGKVYPGMLSLPELAKISNYKGPQEFTP
jgi:glutaredoxin